jgi:chemotaxis protein histidine kinase CheA
MICPNCGQETTGDFCQWCGYPIRRGGLVRRQRVNREAKETEEKAKGEAREAKEKAKRKAEGEAKRAEERAKKEAELAAKEKAKRVARKAKEKAKRKVEGEAKETEEKAKGKPRAEEKEAKLAAKERAKREARKAKEKAKRKVEGEAKRAEEKAKKEAELLAKEKAKREARKAKERAEREAEGEAEPVVVTKLYKGVVELTIVPPVGLGQLENLEKDLRQVENLRLVLVGGSVDRGNKIVVSAEEPIPLLRILGEMPAVEQVVSKGSEIQVTLKAE